MSESAIKRLMALSGGGDATQENIRRLAAEHPDLWKAALEELFRDTLSKTIANPLYGPPGSRTGSVRLEALTTAAQADGDADTPPEGPAMKALRRRRAARQRAEEGEP